jgi:hypothetical protein
MIIRGGGRAVNLGGTAGADSCDDPKLNPSAFLLPETLPGVDSRPKFVKNRSLMEKRG